MDHPSETCELRTSGRSRWWRAGLAVLWWLPCLAWAQADRDRDGLVVEVVPQFQATEVNRTWAPILERLSRETGLRFMLKISKDIPSFEGDVMAGQPDLVYLNPYHQVMAKRAQGYRPLVRDSKMLTGIIVVRRDDPIASTKALAGQELAYPAPNAFGASLLIRAHLAEVDRIVTKPFYAKTHTNAYRQVIMGKAAAAGGVRVTWDKEPDEVKAALRVLWETPPAAPHPISVHPRVPVQQAEAFAQALLKMSRDSAGQALLKDILIPNPVRADYARDYEPLERLQLERYVE